MKIALLLFAMILLKVSGTVIPYLDDVSIIAETFLYLYFLYTKAPVLLNRHFKTRIFKRDFALRIGLLLVPLFLLLVAAVFAPSLFVGSILPVNATLGLDAGQFLLVSFGGVTIASALFSLRLCAKHYQTLERILRKTESQSDLRIDQAYLKAGGVKKFYVSLQVSVQIAFLGFTLFLFWLVMWVIDYAFLILAGGWICYEILNYTKQTRSRRILQTPSKIEEIGERVLFLETFLVGGASGSKGADILMLGGVSILLSCLFLCVSLKYPFLFLSWLLFCGWYILVVTIQIVRRLNRRIASKREKRENEIALQEIPQENPAIFAVSLLFILMTVSRVEDIILQHQLPSYSPFNVIPASSERLMIWAAAKLAMFFLANAVTIYSGIMLAKRHYGKTIVITESSYITDKLKLAWLCVLGVLLVGSAYSDIMLPLLLFICSMIFCSFIIDLRSTFRGIAAWKYGVINMLMMSAVMTGALISIMIISEYNNEVRRFLQPILFPVALLMSVMIILQSYACYQTQVKRLKRTDERKETQNCARKS
ncbi:hypothetical protein E3J74_04500 [Candidatus Bathyarchaeota archaeon]|nr:MAG: hypothetical protein E3J74_04500 [Candidatus Bathyarchaeota archaeon]